MLFTTALIALVQATVAAGADEIGRAEYAAACAACHGKDGEGNGTLAQTLNIDAPGLTGLASQNDGEFPFAKAIRVVDGREEVRLHGSPMPLWGERFFSDASVSQGAWDAEITTRGKLLSLIYYLETIQN